MSREFYVTTEDCFSNIWTYSDIKKTNKKNQCLFIEFLLPTLCVRSTPKEYNFQSKKKYLILYKSPF